MNETLKKLLKQPFTDTAICGKEKCNFGNTFMGLQVFCGGITTDELSNAVSEWFIKAIANQYERDFSEPMKWIINEDERHVMSCENCGAESIRITNYCPDCGQKLDKPE